MSQQDAARQQANTRNNIRVVSIFTAAAIGIVGVLVILYAWQLPPFTRHSQFTDNAYVRGQTTFISPQVNGYITAVNVKDFDTVQPGQVLFQIDDRIYKQRVHQAQATLAMKQAALKNNQQQRKSAEATIVKTRPPCKTPARRIRKPKPIKTRTGTHRGRFVIHSRTRLCAGQRGSRRSRYRTGESHTGDVAPGSAVHYRQSRFAGGRCGQRQSGAGACRNRPAEYADYPPDGRQLGQISVRLGAYVSAGTHLTSLVPPQHWVIANLKETQLAEVRVGQPVTFSVDALNSETFHGKVQSISPATGVEFSAISPDNATGNFVKIAQRIPVRIAVDEGQKNSYRLRPGMSVQVTINTRAENKQ